MHPSGGVAVGYRPDVSRELARPQLVGRAASLGELHDAFADAQHRAAVVVIDGEAGIGKTALLAEFEAQLAGPGVLWIAGGAVDIAGDAVPYAPVTELLRDLRRRHDQSLGVEAVALGRWVVKDRAEMFDRLVDVLEQVRTGADRVVLVLEDLHWADEPTLDLVSFLVRNLSPGFLMLLTHREDESPARGRSTLATVARGGRRISLRALPIDDVRAIVAATRRAPPDDAEVARVHLRGGGNPFLVGELLACEDDRVPASVRDLLLARAHDLDPYGWRVAELAAVIGFRIPHDVLDAARRELDDDLDGADRFDAALQQLARSGLVRVDRDGYQFRHALTREVLTDRLLPGDRRRVHAAVARALAAQPGADSDVGLATELATHWYLARDAHHARPAAIRAAELCMSVFAFAEAWRQYERALADRGVDPGETSDLLLAAAEAARWAGNIATAIDLGRRALAGAPDAASRAQCWERLGQYQWEAGHPDDARTCFQQAGRQLDGMPESPLSATVLASLAHLHLMNDDITAARALSEQALALAARVAAEGAAGRAHITHGMSLCFAGDLDRGVAEVRRGSGLVGTHGDLDARRRADSNLSYVLLMAGDTAAACETSLASLELLRRHGLDAASGAALTSNTVVLLRLVGRWDEADRLSAEALASDVSPGQARYLRLARAELALARGDLPAAAAGLEDTHRLSTGPTQQGLAADLALADADLALAERRLDDALSIVLDLARHLSDSATPRMKLQVATLGLRVQAEAVDITPSRQPRRAPSPDSEISVEFESLLDDAGSAHTPENRALAATARAELSRVRRQPDPDAWAAACEAWERIAQPLQLAYCRLRHAEALLARNGTEPRAAIELRAAHRIATALGANLVTAEVDAIARRARIKLDAPDTDRAPAAPRADRFGLTRREFDVLRELAEGRTNRQIASNLFLSPRTVGVHVSNVLAKLGVANRGQAAARATKLGLLAGDTLRPDTQNGIRDGHHPDRGSDEDDRVAGECRNAGRGHASG